MFWHIIVYPPPILQLCFSPCIFDSNTSNLRVTLGRHQQNMTAWDDFFFKKRQLVRKIRALWQHRSQSSNGSIPSRQTRLNILVCSFQHHTLRQKKGRWLFSSVYFFCSFVNRLRCNIHEHENGVEPWPLSTLKIPYKIVTDWWQEPLLMSRRRHSSKINMANQMTLFQ